MEDKRFYQFYVGIDIGADFHVAACMNFEDFSEERKWKRKKTMKFNADSKGLTDFLNVLQNIQDTLGVNPEDFFMILEPTGGHYSFLLLRVLQEKGYHVYQVENKAVKDYREMQLGMNEKSDEIDARVMAHMGWHKSLHPYMKSVRVMKPAGSTQVLFRTLTRDRWLLTQQLTRRKNQIQQLFAVTNPELKRAFKKVGSITVLKLAHQYPTAKHMSIISQEELRRAIIESGAKRMATKAAATLAELLPGTLALDDHYLVDRQTWLIEEALRLEEAINKIDQQIALYLHGDPVRDIPPHPYMSILRSFPVMSDNIACTIIGAIGDVERFENAHQFNKYLGVSAESKKSGTSVNKTRQTFSGNRDTRRVFFLMSLIMLSPTVGPTVFKAHFDRLVGGRKNHAAMNKRVAIGHVAGKLATVMYSCLKNGVLYDPKIHAEKIGLSWAEHFGKKLRAQELMKYELEAAVMAEEITEDED